MLRPRSRSTSASVSSTLAQSLTPTFPPINPKKLNTLHKAVYTSNLKKIPSLLSIRDPNKRDTHHGFTALHLAARLGSLPCITLLLPYSDIEARDLDGRTPLLCAVLAGHVECISVLVESGANVGVVDARGMGVVHLAIGGSKEVVEKVLEVGGDVNVRDKDGNTSLHYTLLTHTDHTPLLLSKGANPNLPNNLLQTPLHVSPPALIPILLTHGANPSLRDVHGKTPRDDKDTKVWEEWERRERKGWVHEGDDEGDVGEEVSEESGVVEPVLEFGSLDEGDEESDGESDEDEGSNRDGEQVNDEDKQLEDVGEDEDEDDDDLEDDEEDTSDNPEPQPTPQATFPTPSPNEFQISAISIALDSESSVLEASLHSEASSIAYSESSILHSRSLSVSQSSLTDLVPSTHPQVEKDESTDLLDAVGGSEFDDEFGSDEDVGVEEVDVEEVDVDDGLEEKREEARVHVAHTMDESASEESGSVGDADRDPALGTMDESAVQNKVGGVDVGVDGGDDGELASTGMDLSSMEEVVMASSVNQGVPSTIPKTNSTGHDPTSADSASEHPPNADSPGKDSPRINSLLPTDPQWTQVWHLLCSKFGHTPTQDTPTPTQWTQLLTTITPQQHPTPPDLNNTLTDLTTRLTTTMDLLDHAEKNLDENKTEIQNTYTLLHQTQSELAQVSLHRDLSRKRAAALESQVTNLLAQLAEHEGAEDARATMLGQEQRAAAGRADEAERKMGAAQDQVIQVEAMYEAEKRRTRVLGREVRLLRGRVAGFEREQGQAQDHVGHKDDKEDEKDEEELNSLEDRDGQDSTTTTTTPDPHETYITRLESDLKTLQTELLQSRATLAQIQTDFTFRTDELADELKETKRQLVRTTHQLDQTTHDFSNATTKLEHSAQHTHTLTLRIQDLERDIRKRDADLEREKQEKDRAILLTEQTTNDLETLRQELQSESLAIESRNRQIETLRQQIKDLTTPPISTNQQQQPNPTQEDLLTLLNHYDTELKTLTQSLTHEKSLRQSREAEHTAILATVSDLETNLSDLQKAHADETHQHTTRIQSLETALETLQSLSQTQESTVISLQSDLDTFQQRAMDAESHLERLTASTARDLQFHQSTIETLTQTLHSQSHDLETARSLAEDYRRLNETLGEQVGRLEEQVEVRKLELAEQHEREQDLVDRLEQLKEELETRNHEILERRDREGTLVAEMEGLRDELEAKRGGEAQRGEWERGLVAEIDRLKETLEMQTKTMEVERREWILKAEQDEAANTTLMHEREQEWSERVETVKTEYEELIAALKRTLEQERSQKDQETTRFDCDLVQLLATEPTLATLITHLQSISHLPLTTRTNLTNLLNIAHQQHETDKAAMESKTNTLTSTIASLQTQTTNLLAKISDLTSENDRARQHILDLSSHSQIPTTRISELENEVRRLSDLKTELEAYLTQVVGDTERAHQFSKSQSDKYAQKIKALSEELVTYTARTQSLQSQLEETQTKLQSTLQTLGDLENTNKTLSASLTETQSTSRKTWNEKSDLEILLTKERTDHERTVLDLKQTLTTLEVEHLRMEEENRFVRSLLENSAREAAEWGQTKLKWETEKRRLEDLVSAAQDEIKGIEKRKGDALRKVERGREEAESRILVLEKEVHANKLELDAWKTSKTTWEHQRSTLERELESQRYLLHTRETELVTLTKRLTQLSSNPPPDPALLQDKTRLEIQLESERTLRKEIEIRAEKTHTTLQTEIATLSQTRSQLQTHMSYLEQHRQSSETRIQTLLNTLQSIRDQPTPTQLNKANSKIQTLLEEKARLQYTLSQPTNNNETTRLRTQISQLKHALQSAHLTAQRTYDAKVRAIVVKLEQHTQERVQVEKGWIKNQAALKAAYEKQIRELNAQLERFKMRVGQGDRSDSKRIGMSVAT
ncbi:hypothetical protein SpCBS45565_g04096 [Spizellomyces sp. 'palustris']|nr:hypothetical protein SpCBS45565_g04096 [Spizellomyces sp. 'palustris']